LVAGQPVLVRVRERLADSGLVIVLALVGGIDRPKADRERLADAACGVGLPPGGAVHEIRDRPHQTSDAGLRQRRTAAASRSSNSSRSSQASISSPPVTALMMTAAL